MHDEQAVCLEVRETEFRCPGTGLSHGGIATHDDRGAALARADRGFSLWRTETHGNRVAAPASPGREISRWRWQGETPIRDTDFAATIRLRFKIPVLWFPETSWLPTFQHWKARNRGRFVNKRKHYAQRERK